MSNAIHREAENIANEVAYQERLQLAKVPVHLHGGLIRYLVHRIKPGDFLCAVLANDLHGAISRGDIESLNGLPQIVMFLANDAPYMAHGSPLIVESWLSDRGLDS